MTYQEDLINILIIVFTQIFITFFTSKKTHATINKGFKRMESGLNAGPNDKLAQELYSLVESLIDRKIGRSIPIEDKPDKPRETTEGDQGDEETKGGGGD